MEFASLDTSLERLALGELRSEWMSINIDLFAQRLQPEQLVLSEGTGKLGRWHPELRRIELDRALVFGQPWTLVREVLKHEMAHQFVSEVLEVHDETAHGAAFRSVCERFRIDPRAHGLPAVEPSEEAPRSRIVERVAKLLALAASASEHEAQTAMNTAQRLMLEHNVADAQRAGRSFVSRTLGEPATRLEEARSRIGGLIAQHFFVEAVELRVWIARQGRRGTVIEVTGTPENVAMAEYVYAFLDRTADALWAEHKKSRAISGNRDRRAFRAGVVRGFRLKLESERSSHREHGLVWVGDPALHEHHRTRYPRLVHIRRGGNSGHEARRHGEAAGQTVVLHRPVEGGHTARPSGPLRLGPGRS